jgi:hypothetical protein
LLRCAGLVVALLAIRYPRAKSELGIKLGDNLVRFPDILLKRDHAIANMIKQGMQLPAIVLGLDSVQL